jgi:hypothetical protein
MVLVHDDDLARISGICDINVRKASYGTCVVLPNFTGTGNPPTRCSGKLPAESQRGDTHRSML